MRIKSLLVVAAAAAVLLSLTGCVGSNAPAPKPSNTNTTVKENGNGRLDPRESITSIPTNAKELKALACSIVKTGKITAVNAQQLNGWGQYMKYFVDRPDSLNAGSGVTNVADAQRLQDIYIPLGTDVYNRTLKENIDLPGDLKTELSAVCEGDIFAGK